MRQKWFQPTALSEEDGSYTGLEFDDLLIQYVALVRRQFITTYPVLAHGKITGFTPLGLPNAE